MTPSDHMSAAFPEYVVFARKISGDTYAGQPRLSCSESSAGLSSTTASSSDSSLICVLWKIWMNKKQKLKQVEIKNSSSRANVSMGRVKVTKFASTHRTAKKRRKRFKGVNQCLTQSIKSTRNSHELNSTTCMKVTLSLYRQSQTQYLGW